MSRQVDLDLRLKLARRAVHDACAVCREVQRRLADVRTRLKDDRSPVTVADFASQAVIVRRLRESLGDVVMIAEEAADQLRDPAWERMLDAVVEAVRVVWPDADAESTLAAIDVDEPDPSTYRTGVHWTLDPIDGTKGFLRGDQYAVSLAWIEAGVPTLGVLGCPNLSADFGRPFDDPDPHGCIYFACQGSGLWEAPADDPDHAALHIRRLEHDEREPIRVAESVEAAHSKQSDTARILDSLGGADEMLRLDGQGKYAVVARGQADAYLRMPTKKGYVERIWDHAAGCAIANESGCAVTDIGGASLNFGLGAGLEKNRGVVCAPGALHGRIVGSIETLGLNAAAT